jgi:hypothetical protein
MMANQREEYAVPLADGNWGNAPYQLIQCPICGEDYHHPGTPLEEDSQDAYKAGWSGRGSLTAIPMEGECGHTWDLCVGFHKGNCYLFARAEQAQP